MLIRFKKVVQCLKTVYGPCPCPPSDPFCVDSEQLQACKLCKYQHREQLNSHGVWARHVGLNSVLEISSSGGFMCLEWGLRCKETRKWCCCVVWHLAKALVEGFLYCSWYWLQQLLRTAFLLPLGRLLTLVSFFLTYSGTSSCVHLSPFLLTAITVSKLCCGNVLFVEKALGKTSLSALTY